MRDRSPDEIALGIWLACAFILLIFDILLPGEDTLDSKHRVLSDGVLLFLLVLFVLITAFL